MEPCEKSISAELQNADEALEVAAEAVEKGKDSAEQSAVNYNAMSKEELLEALADLVEQPADEVKDKVAAVKYAFYSIRRLELEAEKSAFLEKGNEESAFAPMADEKETRFKELLAKYKELRAARQETLDAEMRENAEKKRAVIAALTEIVEDPDNINKQYTRFQQLQQDFKMAGNVLPSEDKVLWKDFQAATERFYDLWKINKELRDYDFKKNLEAKQGLCEEAEALADEKDVLAAFKKLQALHDKWRDVGPVVKELREDLWKRFKEASTVINKRHQAFFEGRKENEKENEDAKVAICEEAESIDLAALTAYAKWDEATKKIIELQERWKTLGFAARKVNNELFVRFRKVCDEFFTNKAAFFKKMKEDSAANLAKKHQLCERAEALKDSTDWKKTAEELTALQKAWKEVGPVSKKSGDAVWKRFIAACDYFFENKSKNVSGTRQAEYENLKAKRVVVEKLNNLDSALSKDEAKKLLKELSAEYQNVGHVPYKEKDKIYDDYKTALNAAYDKFGINESHARMENFANDVDELASDKNKLYKEREKLVRLYEQKKSEIMTCENNFGFFNVKSKAGNSVLKEMERHIARAKEDLAILEKKIELIDDKI